LAVFVGVGLVALPVDLINEFRTRPTPLDLKTYNAEKIKLGERARELGTIAKDFKKEIDEPSHSKAGKNRREDKKVQNRLEVMTHELKNQYAALQIAYIERGGNPLWWYFLLLLGIIGSMFSLTWIVHIALNVLPPTPVAGILNSLFITLETAIPGFSLFWSCCILFVLFLPSLVRFERQHSHWNSLPWNCKDVSYGSPQYYDECLPV